jgi:tRNA threonylcarbamoyladenosine biosynthesis protein TsaB
VEPGLNVVGFDSATDDTVVAALAGGNVEFESRVGPGPDGRPEHTRTLLAGIGDAVDSLGGWQAVDRIAVGLGPGTFTGLRIAVSTATGLSISTGTVAVGVSTLDALARSMTAGEATVVPMLDARRGEVFMTARAADGGLLLPPAAVSPEDALESIRSLTGPLRVGGPGAVRFRDLFADAGIRIDDPESEKGRLSGVAICEIGAAAGEPPPDEPLEPIYIREPDAKLWLERDARPAAG